MRVVSSVAAGVRPLPAVGWHLLPHAHPARQIGRTRPGGGAPAVPGGGVHGLPRGMVRRPPLRLLQRQMERLGAHPRHHVLLRHLRRNALL